ncbi:hypothetical protein AB0D04_17205 [Streptomyces sp. NPDC048483]
MSADSDHGGCGVASEGPSAAALTAGERRARPRRSVPRRRDAAPQR